MKHVVLVCLGVVLAVGSVWAQSPPQQENAGVSEINWQQGPIAGRLGSVATIQVPKGYVFAGADDARVFLESLGNPASDTTVGVILPADGQWFALFEFEDIGYVKEDEKDSLDADAILDTIRKGTAEANKERAKRGWTAVEVVGWGQKPVYNPQTHNLEWGVIGKGTEGEVINYNTRVLGRRGVMAVKLVDGLDTYQKSLLVYRRLLGGFQFVQGETYAEYRKGDKLAKYGLTALIAGGAAAVAFKTGLFRYIWKILVIGVVAVGGLFKRIFGGGRRSQY